VQVRVRRVWSGAMPRSQTLCCVPSSRRGPVGPELWPRQAARSGKDSPSNEADANARDRGWVSSGVLECNEDDDLPLLMARLSAATALTVPAQRAQVKFDEDALDLILDRADGYPYFLQQWGETVWREAEGRTITLRDAEAAEELVNDELDRRFFRDRYERATEAERIYMAAIADLGDGRHSSSEIAHHLGMTPKELSVRRAGLIEKGLIFNPVGTQLDFTVPQFAIYGASTRLTPQNVPLAAAPDERELGLRGLKLRLDSLRTNKRLPTQTFARERDQTQTPEQNHSAVETGASGSVAKRSSGHRLARLLLRPGRTSLVVPMALGPLHPGRYSDGERSGRYVDRRRRSDPTQVRGALPQSLIYRLAPLAAHLGRGVVERVRSHQLQLDCARAACLVHPR